MRLRKKGILSWLCWDCEDAEPDEVFGNFCPRIARLNVGKKVGVVLFKAEFETLFVICLPEIAAAFPEYDWLQHRLTVSKEVERIRDAKGWVSAAMRTRAYKATRDQAKFITALNWDKLRAYSASFIRFEQTVLWLAGKLAKEELIYPCV